MVARILKNLQIISIAGSHSANLYKISPESIAFTFGVFIIFENNFLRRMIRKKEITKEKALERLASLCSRSEQCESDLTKKMINWGINAIDRNEVLEYLRVNRYVDDARFARSFTNDKARFSSWGPLKIKMELVKRRIKGALISEALQNVDQQVWKDSLLKCANTKAKNLDLTDDEEGFANRQKLFRYLIGRGFPSSASYKAVNLMKKKQQEDK